MVNLSEMDLDQNTIHWRFDFGYRCILLLHFGSGNNLTYFLKEAVGT